MTSHRSAISWLVRVGILTGLLAMMAVGAPCRGLAQESPPPSDRIEKLAERVEALQRENTRLESLIQQKGFDSSEAPPTTASPDTIVEIDPAAPCAPEGTFIERMGTRYDNGFLLVESPDPQRVPFQLKLNVFNQLRYLNQELDSSSFTDHLGNVHSVDARNDINLNRNLYYFGGYAFDPKLVYNIIIWSSNSVATVIQGGYIGYQFDESFTLYGGYWEVPGSRSNTRNFMFLPGVERSMADSFFRPGFTQGIWGEGKVGEELYYTGFVGNSMNTLNVNSSKIDKNFVYAGSTWWEPLGDFAPPGALRMAFSDLEYHENAAIRVGASFIGSREDRFSNSGTSNPENVAIYNSDGVLLFAPGSLAPGVTVNLANYYMLAQDFGFKYRGFAFNAQYFLRWINNFKADGPLPMQETFDQGFEMSAGYFVIPKTLELYGRSSAVYGEFRDSSEYAVGFNWHPWQNRGFRLIGEANRVDKSPTSSIQTTYNAGMTGWNYVLQTQLYF